MIRRLLKSRFFAPTSPESLAWKMSKFLASPLKTSQPMKFKEQRLFGRNCQRQICRRLYLVLWLTKIKQSSKHLKRRQVMSKMVSSIVLFSFCFIMNPTFEALSLLKRMLYWLQIIRNRKSCAFVCALILRIKKIYQRNWIE